MQRGDWEGGLWDSSVVFHIQVESRIRYVTLCNLHSIRVFPSISVFISTIGLIRLL